MTAITSVEAAQAAVAEIWRALGPRGAVEGAFKAFRAGHMPKKGPYWYSATVFNGLSEPEIDKLESQLPYPVPEQTRAKIPRSMRDLLSVTNGLHLHNLSLDGQQGRVDHGAGAPYSLALAQLERPPGVPKTWFCIGTMNGPRRSQGKLLLTESEEVVLVHRDRGDIGARWPDLADFLVREIPRLLRVHDDRGDLVPGESNLPGNTVNWEEIAVPAIGGNSGWRGRLRPLSDRLREVWPPKG
jgi:hypothetical protein